MRLSNPNHDVPAFGPCLFGRARAKVPAHALQAESIAGLRQTFSPLIPEARWGSQPLAADSRERVFTALITFWAFLSQVLSVDSACRTAVRKVQAWWTLQGKGPLSANTSAYCQARNRLRNEMLEAIQQQLVRGLEDNVSSDPLGFGRRVKIVDGTACSMPDTVPNQALFPQPSNQKPGCGFPMLKLVGLFSLATGALLHAVYGPLRVHDVQLLRQLWNSLTKGDVLLADRGFCSFGCLAMLQQAGVDSLMRLHQRRPADFRRGQRLGKDDRLVAWTKPLRCPCRLSPEQFAALPETLTVRLLRVKPTVKGFRTQQLVLVTTLLDAVAYPAEALAALYLQRWGVELHFRELKTLLRLDVLRCRSPQMIHKEVLLHLIAYNLVRAVMQHAARCHHVDLSRISFKGTLETVQQFAAPLQASGTCPRHRAALEKELLRLIASDLVPWRPGRAEPRAKKRRPKNYQLLTRPRHAMALTQHRCPHKAPLT